MKIAIDIDEVLADFANPLDRYVRKKYGVKMDREKWNTKDWWLAWGGSKTTAVVKLMSFMLGPEFDKIKVVPGAKAGVKALKKMGHDLIIVTGRPTEVMDKTKVWLDKNFPGVFSAVYSTDFHLINKTHLTKGEICAAKKCSLLIDDFPHYAEECVAKGIKVLLFNTGFNHFYQEHGDVRRVKNWSEAVAEVRILNQKDV